MAGYENNYVSLHNFIKKKKLNTNILQYNEVFILRGMNGT